MATSITCPECEAVLKPARPVPPGKSVKCPKCGAGFVVPGEEPVPRAKPKGATAPARKADRPSARPAAKPAKAGKKKGSEQVTKKPGKEEKAPAPAAKNHFADEDDGTGLTYGVTQEEEPEGENKPKITYAPDTSIKDLRGPAQEAVMRPTNMLVLVGVLSFIGYLALLIIILIPILFPLDVESTDKNRPTPVLDVDTGLGGGTTMMGKELEDKKEDPSMFILLGFDLGIFALYPWYMLILYLMPIILGMAYCGVTILGAVKTQNLESRQWGIASCIMTMVPYNGAGLMVVIMLIFNILFNMLFDDPDFVTLMLIVIAVLIALAEIGVATWALVVFLKEEVIAGFEYQAE